MNAIYRATRTIIERTPAGQHPVKRACLQFNFGLTLILKCPRARPYLAWERERVTSILAADRVEELPMNGVTRHVRIGPGKHSDEDRAFYHEVGVRWNSGLGN